MCRICLSLQTEEKKREKEVGSRLYEGIRKDKTKFIKHCAKPTNHYRTDTGEMQMHRRKKYIVAHRGPELDCVLRYRIYLPSSEQPVDVGE